MKRIALSAAALLAATLPVAAADMASPVPVSTGDTIPVYDNVTDWTGFYAGVFGQVATDATGTYYGAGLEVGANAQYDLFVLGLEADIVGLTDGTNKQTYGDILARGGVLVTDDLLFYGAVGYGANLGGGDDQHILVGGGLEYAVNDAFTLDAEYLYGAPNSATSTQRNIFTLGTKWHF